MTIAQQGETVLRRVLANCLLLLVGCNILWTLVLARWTPLLGAAAYAMVLLQVLRHSEYRASFFVGLIGGALHLFEVLRSGYPSATVDSCLAIVNIALPFVIAGLGAIAWRRHLGHHTNHTASSSKGDPGF